MAVLSDTDLLHIVRTDPVPAGQDLAEVTLTDRESQVQPCSLDLTLGNNFVFERRYPNGTLIAALGTLLAVLLLHLARSYFGPQPLPSPWFGLACGLLGGPLAIPLAYLMAPWQKVKRFYGRGDQVVIPPRSFVLATTDEWVSLPPTLLGRVDGRSSLGRLGLFVENAGFIDPGFRGTITLEFFNASRLPVTVTVGQRICQMSLETLSSPCTRPYGDPSRQSKYQGQSGATMSRITLEVPHGK
jgi:deoxycytidine triphosphate deaminase